MKEYTVSVRSANMTRYDEPLEFRTGSVDEALQVISMMLKYGHMMDVQCKEIEPVDAASKPAGEPAEVMAIEFAAGAGGSGAEEEALAG